MDKTPLSVIKDTILNSSLETTNKIIAFWPNVLGAMGVLLVGWGVSSLVEKFIVKSSDKLKLGWISEKIGLDSLLEKMNATRSPARIIGSFLKGYIFTMFLISSCKIVQLTQIANFLDAIISYIPKIIVALIIVLIGTRISNTMCGIVYGALRFSSKQVATVVSEVARYSLIFFSILAAVANLDIATTLIEILFIGFVSMIALAGGLALGLGGKEITRELLDDLRKKDMKTKKR